MKLPTLRAWACPAACLAMALVVAGVAAAQDEQDQRNQDEDQQQQQSYDQSDRDRDSERDEQDRQRQRQDAQRDQQQRERDQQERQRDQQNQQEDQQDRQRDQQDRQRSQQSQQWDQQDRQRSQQTQWDEGRTRQRETSSWPEPTRYQSGQQQTRYEAYGQRQSSQFDRGSNEQDAGLGVYIISDGGEGVRVTQVNAGSPAEEMGLRPNDRITQINGQQISSDQQFISRIRNMNPGDEVELEVLRDRSERIIRGELESRQEALVLSNRGQGQSWQQGIQPSQQGSENWQTGYQEGGYSDQQQGRTRIADRGGDFNNRISSIEQQVNRLSRELEQIRYALQDIRGESGQFSRFPQRGGETQAGYDEFQSGRIQDGRTRFQQSDDQSGRIRGEIRDDQSRQGGTFFRDTRQGQSFQDSGQFDGEFDRSRGGRSSIEGGTDSEGGVTGSLRTRPQNDQNWSDRQ